MDTSAERVARNDATFRAANEKIAAAAADRGVDGLLPFICECADERCTEVIRLSPEEYAHVRSSPTTFANAIGHHLSAGPHARVVGEYERYSVVEKVGRAADVAADLEQGERAT